MSQSESRVIVGLNDYRFVASLHVQHKSIPLEEITESLGLTPRRVRRQGEPRSSPKGSLLSGVFDANHWSTDLLITAGHDIDQFLMELVSSTLKDSLEFTRRIDETGGSICVFLGVFATRLCDFEIQPETLRRLGSAGVSVRFDYYPAEDREQ